MRRPGFYETGYPSSKRVKDWDKLEAEVKKQEKDEKLEGDAALNKWNLMGQYSQQTGKKLELRKSRALLLMSLAKAKSFKKGWWLWWKKIEKELQKAKRVEPWKRFVKARRMNQGYLEAVPGTDTGVPDIGDPERS
ncbi:hypothetical protein DY000_02017264 [Brassica cretica]|uniref:Uncharacterized protein n=1 Tax=Brassica cretica TaxID=69181 RepID=A0ABQ7D4A8_BRACR|nr:hypothetical protein DY000_02017264 [Brassica cretica]